VDFVFDGHERSADLCEPVYVNEFVEHRDRGPFVGVDELQDGSEFDQTCDLVCLTHDGAPITLGLALTAGAGGTLAPTPHQD
jgi:hypothetical protein